MRVLVVDDDQAVVDTLRGLIEDLGHETSGANSGPEALDSFRRGREVLRRLRVINRETRLVALTGQPIDLPDALAADIPLVRKPVFTTAVVSKLLGAVARSPEQGGAVVANPPTDDATRIMAAITRASLCAGCLARQTGVALDRIDVVLGTIRQTVNVTTLGITCQVCGTATKVFRLA